MSQTRQAARLDATSRALLHRLWRDHVRTHRGRLLLVALLTLLMAGTSALYPLLIDRAFTMFTRHDERILYQIPFLAIALTSAKALAQFLQTVEVQRVVLQTIRDLQERMFSHLTHADLARLEREPPAQLATRFTTDAATIRESLTRATNGIADLLSIIGLVGAMFYLDWQLSLIAALLYPIAIMPIERIGRRARRASGSMQARMGEAATILNESFTQARVVRAYGLEGAEEERARRAFNELYRALMRIVRNRARVDPVLEVLGGVTVAAVIGFVGWRAAVGDQTLGNFMGFVSALLIAARPARSLGSLNTVLQEGLAGLTRVFAVIDETSRIADAPDAHPLPSGSGEVVFEDVYFIYPDGRVGLEGLSFRAAPGATVALVGPSGAGKSTALALLPRLYDVAAGRVLVDGADVRTVTQASLRAAMAYVGQDTLLFDDTIAANIRVGRPDASDADIEAAAQAAAAADFIAAMPDGYATRVGTSGQALSGGQRQRIAIARALLRNPRVLLLDEATSALDAESESAIQAALARLRHNRTMIVIAHRLSTVRDADLVVVVDNGRAVELGTHATLLAANGLYARLVRSQALAA